MKGFETTLMLKAARLLLGMALVMILVGCGTIRTTPDQPPAPNANPAGKFVPCSQDPTIIFHAPKDGDDVSESAANIFDTPETISAVRKHNAAVREACDK